MKVVCVIPAWNEAETIESSVLPRVVEELKSKVDSIVIVEDGSKDFTKEVAEKLEADVLHHAINRGQGAALKTGTEYALEQGADIIIHFDADGQFQSKDIEKMIEPIRLGVAEIVFGSRFLDDSTKMPPFKKKVIMPLARFINRFLFGIQTTDPQSGFRALSRKAAQRIDWHQDEMAHCSEILVAAHESGLPIAEVPITVLYDEYGQRFSEGFKILRDLFFAKMNN
jgi:glycosyltransferase involved in cell wall biosynthesis